MPKTITITDLSDRVFGTLKNRAAREKLSLSGLIRSELERSAQRVELTAVKRLSMQQWLEQIRQAKPLAVSCSAAKIIRQLRDSTDS